MSLKKAAQVLETAQHMLTPDDRIIGHRARTSSMHFLMTSKGREIIVKVIDAKSVSIQYFQNRQEWIASGKGSDTILTTLITFKD